MELILSKYSVPRMSVIGKFYFGGEKYFISAIITGFCVVHQGIYASPYLTFLFIHREASVVQW